MKTPHDLSGPELARALRKLGYAATRQNGSHVRVTTQQGGEHREVVNPQAPSSSARSRAFSAAWRHTIG